MVEAVAKKYDDCKDEADCHPSDEGNSIAQKGHVELRFLTWVGSAKSMPIYSGRWAAWRGGKENAQQPAHVAAKVRGTRQGNDGNPIQRAN